MLMEMVQLRWLHTVIDAGIRREETKLQYRFITPNVDASGAMCPPGVWSEWIDVPAVAGPAQSPAQTQRIAGANALTDQAENGNDE